MLCFSSQEFLKELQENLLDYVPNFYDPKPGEYKLKRELAIKREYSRCNNNDFGDIYDIQLKAVSIINDIGSSHLLALNDVILAHLVREYKELKSLLVLINAEMKRLNQFQELKPFLHTYKPKDLDSYLYNDLTTVVNAYKLDSDVKELMKLEV